MWPAAAPLKQNIHSNIRISLNFQIKFISILFIFKGIYRVSQKTLLSKIVTLILKKRFFGTSGIMTCTYSTVIIIFFKNLNVKWQKLISIEPNLTIRILFGPTLFVCSIGPCKLSWHRDLDCVVRLLPPCPSVRACVSTNWVLFSSQHSIGEQVLLWLF